MGDVSSLIEKIEREADLKEVEELIQLRMGSLSQLLALLPNIGPFKDISKLDLDDRQLIPSSS